jgi:hypothetical protein
MDTSGRPDKGFSRFLLLMTALVPSLFGLLLLWKVDPRGGGAVAALFLVVNLICSVAAGIVVSKSTRMSNLTRRVAAFFVGVVLFFVNWGVLILADLFLFNPIRS